MVKPIYLQSGQDKAASLEDFHLNNMKPVKDRRNEIPRVFSTDKIDENPGTFKDIPKKEKRLFSMDSSKSGVGDQEE